VYFSLYMPPWHLSGTNFTRVPQILKLTNISNSKYGISHFVVLACPAVKHKFGTRSSVLTCSYFNSTVLIRAQCCSSCCVSVISSVLNAESQTVP
jgi:hypothetical protein